MLYGDYLTPKYWPTWLGLALLRLISFLPLPIIALLGQSLGWLAYLLIGSRRKIAFKNISSCFPEWTAARCRQVNRKHFRLVGQTLFTAPMNMWISAARFNRLVTITGREHYAKALAEQRNIILLAPHFIGIDVSGLALSYERPLISMYQYAKNGLVDTLSKRGRSRYGGILIERKEPLRKVLRLISKGDPFYFLPDQDAGRKGIFVPFFHTQASTSPTLGKYAGFANAVVIPCHTRIRSWGRGYEVRLGEAMASFPSGDELADTVQMNQTIEQMVRHTPEQYFWVHKRFKTRPADESSKFYDFL